MYKVVYAEGCLLQDAVVKVETEVNKLKKEGWNEQGGIAISRSNNRIYHHVAQAMVKNGE